MLSNKTDLLDPLSVIIKLHIYSHMSAGTKMSIGNNKISIQESGIFQSTVRKLMGDSKNDLNTLFNPIMYACDTYLKGDLKEKYFQLFESAANAFDKLKETYTGSDIIFTIENLKTNMELFLNNENYNIQNIISDINNPQHSIKFQIYLNIGKVWSEDKLNILFGYLHELENNDSEEKISSILHALLAFMEYVDLCTKNTINSLG
jgi:hypothetical protein